MVGGSNQSCGHTNLVFVDVHGNECKFKRKVGILPCPGLTVDVLEPVLEHCHDDDPDRHAKGLKAKKRK